MIERGNTAAYLAARRKRDNPDIAAKLVTGIVRELGVVDSGSAKRRDQALLAELTPWERELVQEVTENLPARRSPAMLKAAGM